MADPAKRLPPPPSPSASPDVIVVGGGIVGTSAAAFLAAAGARVLLVERDALASGASGANSGVVQHPFDPVLAHLYRESLARYRELATGSNAFTIGAEPAGLLYVSAGEAAARQQAAMIARPFPELRPEVLGGAALRAVEPALAPDLWACRVPVGYPVAPGSGTYAFATLAETRGVVVRTGRAAVLEVAGDAVVGVQVDGRIVAAGAVIAAAGPWTPQLVDPTGSWAPIAPRWGVVVDAELGAPPRHVLEEAGIEAVLDEGAEATPVEGEGAARPAVAPNEIDDDGIEFSFIPHPGAGSVGSTFLPVEPNPEAWVERILVRAMRFVPAMGDAPIRGVRCCPRPQSADGRPLIGAVPWLRNAFVCAGHGPWGVSTGPASGRLVADLVLGRDPAIPAELDPARFGSRP
ncbi:MAG TPA: FAD-dependent oxidoreductase [Candidatus Limnocylindrales bacterium]